MIITRQWEMPNSNTFSIKCIERFIHRYKNGGVSIDPFANTNRIATVTNDLNQEYGADYCMDALDFLKTQSDNSCDLMLFDPPYSPRQVSECYKKAGRMVNMQTTQARFWSDLKKEIGRIVKPGGHCLTFGWNSGGVGMKYGFKIVEILIVPHGGWHNDTICTAEIKLATT